MDAGSIHHAGWSRLAKNTFRISDDLTGTIAKLMPATKTAIATKSNG